MSGGLETKSASFQSVSSFCRDGVGEGRLHQINQVELEAIKKCIRQKCQEESAPEIKLTLTNIIVTNRFISPQDPETHEYSWPRLVIRIRNREPWWMTSAPPTCAWKLDFFLVNCPPRNRESSQLQHLVIVTSRGMASTRTNSKVTGISSDPGLVLTVAPCQNRRFDWNCHQAKELFFISFKFNFESCVLIFHV